MANNREQFTTEIYVNQQQANDAMAKLQAQVDKTARAYEKLLNAKDQDPAKTEKARKAWEQATQTMKNAERGVEEYGKALKNLSGQSMNTLLKMQKQLRSEMNRTKPNTKEWRELAKQYGQVTQRVRDLRHEYDATAVSQNNFSAKMSGLWAKLGKAKGWIAAIVAALKAIVVVEEEIVKSSQTLSDAWNNDMNAMKTTVNAFFMALSSGDWTAFNNGISEALKKARELSVQLDLINDYLISGKVIQSEYMTDFNQKRVIATDTEADIEERKAALKTMEDDISHYSSFVKDQANETWKGITQSFDVWKGIQFDTAEEFEQFFVRYFEYGTTARDQSVKDLKAAYDNMRQAQKTIEMYSTSITSNGDAWVKAYEKLDEATAAYEQLAKNASKETRAIVMALELPDDKKKEVQELFSNYRASLDQVNTMERSFQRTRDRVNKEIDKGTASTKSLTKATDEYAEAIKRIDKAEAVQINTVKQLYAAGLMDKQTYEAQKAVIEEDYLKQRMATAEKYGKDTDKFMSQLLDRQIARLEWAKKQLADEMDEMGRYYQSLQDSDSANFGGEASSNIADAEAYESFMEEVYRKAADIRASILDDSARQTFETEMQWAQKLAEHEIITQEEAQQRIMQLKMDYARQAAQQLSSITSEAANFVSALQDAELAALDADYQAQLTAAGNSAEERERIETNFQKKKLDIQKQYADMDMAINIAKAIAAGAVAVMQAFAQLGPIGGAVSAALIGATTATEVAVIVAQRNAIKNSSVANTGVGSASSVGTLPENTDNIGARVTTGYSQGGPTRRSTSDATPAGIVHANEWVAPAWMVRSDPVTFANLERYRRRGSRGRSGSASRGFADGGYTGDTDGSRIDSELIQVLQQVQQSNSRLSRQLEEGIRAYVALSEIEREQKMKNGFKKMTSL